MKTTFISSVALAWALAANAQNVQLFKYGDFNDWVTREVKESSLLGGHVVDIYEIGPTQTIVGNKPYTPLGGSPWATSNVLAKPAGIVKASCTVSPAPHPGNGLCACMVTDIARCRVIGIININVLATGSVFLGQMIEPITSTSNPYSKMEMGIPFNQRPRALVFDYKLEIPNDPKMVYSPGFGRSKTEEGCDKAEVFVLLQRRWEDAEGNLYAKRVGTGREFYCQDTDWKVGHRIPISYGDMSAQSTSPYYMGLIPEDHSYYARNSHGKMVPVNEVGWDDANATPTHIIVMFSSGSGDAYQGTPGMALYIDNAGLQY